MRVICRGGPGGPVLANLGVPCPQLILSYMDRIEGRLRLRQEVYALTCEDETLSYNHVETVIAPCTP